MTERLGRGLDRAGTRRLCHCGAAAGSHEPAPTCCTCPCHQGRLVHVTFCQCYRARPWARGTRRTSTAGTGPASSDGDPQPQG